MTLFKPYADVWPHTKAVFAQFHPELLEEVKAFGPLPPSAFAQWLDEKFPHPNGGGWGPTDITQVPVVLREMMENAHVG